MNRIFGSAARKKSPPSLQTAIESTENRIRSFEVKIKKLEAELLRYHAQMRGVKGITKNALRERALRTLKHKKVYESRLTQLTQQVFNMEEAELTTEHFKNTMATFDAMREANKEMKKNFRDIDKVMDDMEEMERQKEDMESWTQEFEDFLSRSYAVPDGLEDEDLEAELEALDLEDDVEYLEDLNKVPELIDNEVLEQEPESPLKATQTTDRLNDVTSH